MASEDIGQANPQALTQAVSAFQATQLIGRSLDFLVIRLWYRGELKLGEHV